MKAPTAARPVPEVAAADAPDGDRQRLRRIVHDLNTPLSAVSLQLFLHRRSLAKPTQQELRFLDVLDRNVERIRILVATLAPAPAPAAVAVAAQPIRPPARRD